MPPSTDAGTEFADLNPTNAGYAATAARRVADARPRSGSVTQSSNVNNGITVDRVTVTAQYGDTENSYSIRNGSSWSIEGSGHALEKRTNGGTLYVNVGSYFEPLETPVAPVGNDGTQDVPPGTRVYSGNVNITSRSVSGLSGSLDGVQGTFACTGGGCAVSGGLITGGMWTFTPDQPPSAVNVPGVSGVVFTGTFDPNRTPGTYNGQTGFFRCVSLSTGCAQQTTNGRLTGLEGEWIFVPSAGGTPNTPNTLDTDYLASGIWLFVPDNATSADDVVFGAFADGSDPFMQSNLMALQGTARYDGEAGGVYSAKSSSGTELGYWLGDLVLTADFGDQSNLGTISGSVTDIKVSGSVANLNVGDERYSGSLSLGAAPIGSSNSGFFEGLVSGAVEGSAYAGRWGGQFFGNGEADGKPGYVGGTLGGRSTDDTVNFVGVFDAHKQ